MNKGRFSKGHKTWNKGKRILLDINVIKKMYLEEEKSTFDISKELNVSQKTIENRLKEEGIEFRKEHTELTKNKIRETNIRKGIKPKERYSGEVWNKGLTEDDERVRNNIKGLKEAREYQVMPLKDSSIELKIQNFLNELEIEFISHKYILIGHPYQCDIFIPSMNLVIECDGNYWHNYPYGRDIDKLRTTELKELGFNILRLWETEINKMDIEDFKNLLKEI